MSVRDVQITSWASGLVDYDENDPADALLIAGDLPAQFRNIKSVYRTDSQEKGWIRSNTPTTYLSSTEITQEGDTTNQNQRGQMLLLRSNLGLANAFIVDSSYDTPNDRTVLTLAVLTVGFNSTLSEVIYSADNPLPLTSTFDILAGTFTAVGDGATTDFTIDLSSNGLDFNGLDIANVACNVKSFTLPGAATDVADPLVLQTGGIRKPSGAAAGYSWTMSLRAAPLTGEDITYQFVITWPGRNNS